MSEQPPEGITSAISSADDTPAVTAATETTTLAGRTEVIGRTYPSWVEKLIFLSAVGGAIWLGLWIWQSSDWHVAGKWAVSICGLPIMVLIITEAIGRVIQSRVPR
jgi:hypothetical protein